MERFTVEVNDEETAHNLRDTAASNGHSVEEELRQVVADRYGTSRANGPDLIDELIAMTRPGIDIYFPPREMLGMEPPFIHDDFS